MFIDKINCLYIIFGLVFALSLIFVSFLKKNKKNQRIALQKLQEKQIDLENMFQEIPSILFLIDFETSKIVSYNKLAQESFGCSTELIGQQFNSIFDSSKQEEIRNNVNKYLTNQNFLSFELNCIANKKEVFPAELTFKTFYLHGVKYMYLRIFDLSYKKIEKENQFAFLKLKKQALDSYVHQKNLSVLIHGQEMERTRIAKELHDGIGQMLTAVKLQLSVLNKSSAYFEEDQENAKKIVTETIEEIKRISNNLMPLEIEDFGLIAALQNIFNLLPNPLDLVFEFDPQLESIKFTKEQEICIYRIVQEGVNNALKYSNASQIKVTFYILSDELVSLLIEDNGKGFKQDKIIGFYQKRTINNGLKNMIERAALINSKLHIDSKVGEGTKISLSIPIQITQYL